MVTCHLDSAMLRGFRAAVATVAVAVTAAACGPADGEVTADLAIQNVTVVDAANGVREARTVSVLDGRIVAVQGADEPIDAREVVDGVMENREAIDALLDKAAANWELARMAAVDRNALRIGCYELLHAGDVPTKVAINEALSLIHISEPTRPTT